MSPTLIVATAPVRGIIVRMYVCMYVCMHICMYVCMYVCIYLSIYLSIYVCIIYPAGFWDPCTPRNALCVPVYWCAHMRDLQLYLTEQQGHEGRLELLVSAMKIIDEDKYVNVHTHDINCRFSLLRQWSCTCLASCQRACVNVNQKWPVGLLYCCFAHSYRHRCSTELTTVPMCYLWM